MLPDSMSVAATLVDIGQKIGGLKLLPNSQSPLPQELETFKALQSVWKGFVQHWKDLSNLLTLL